MKLTSMKTLVCSAAFAVLVSGSAMAADKAVSSVINNAGDSVGTIALTQGPEGVLLDVDLKDMPPGAHGFHIHSIGDCSDHDAFKEAAGHISDDDDQHGLLNPDGPEAGDLPNIIVPENGVLKVQFYAHDLEIHPEDGDDVDEETLLDSDGSAFMIHEGPDDHKTQPIGGAGARIACGVIEAP